jgi:transcriptional regulator GlxA family with amidase domain
MLEQQRLAVSDVANVCGFESRTAFSRAFKRHFGISPSTVQAPA